MTTAREVLILGFLTKLNRMRSLSIPDPAPGIDASQALNAANNIINSNIFDPAIGNGSLDVLNRVHHERTETTTLF